MDAVLVNALCGHEISFLAVNCVLYSANSDFFADGWCVNVILCERRLQLRHIVLYLPLESLPPSQ
jgi:hypothetical protein